MLDLTSLSSCYTPSAVHQRCTLPSETFLKESFFDDVVDTTSLEVFSEAESASSLEENLDAFIVEFDSDAVTLLEENLDAFIDNFDSEMLLH